MAEPPITERHKHHFHRKSPIKEPVRVATTAPITISTALNNGDSLDGVTLATGDRVLVKDQSSGAENGIYIVGASPARAYDFSTDDPDVMGAIIRVLEGTTNGGTTWANTNATSPTIGSTAITFAAMAGGSGAPTTADYLVGTAQGGLSAEIVVGTAPGGELGGTWASPTVDATHSGSAHTDFIAKSLLTTQDDIIVRDGTGPARLAKGSDGQVLTVDPTTHHLVWATPSAGSGDVATDTIWDAKGDLAGGTGSDTAARLAVGSDGDVLTADSGETTGMKWAAPTGGSSSIQYGALKPGSPLDDFDASSLDGAWLAHSSGGSFATGHCYTQGLDGSSLVIGYRASMGALYRATTNVDQEWQAGGIRFEGQITGAAAVMPGIGVLDTSGNGVAVIVYNDSAAYLAQIDAWQYNSQHGTLSTGINQSFGHNVHIATEYTLRLTRVGNTWDGYLSIDGGAWTAHSNSTYSRTITAAYKVVGLFYNTAAVYQGRMIVDWVYTV